MTLAELFTQARTLCEAQPFHPEAERLARLMQDIRDTYPEEVDLTD